MHIKIFQESIIIIFLGHKHMSCAVYHVCMRVCRGAVHSHHPPVVKHGGFHLECDNVNPPVVDRWPLLSTNS